MLHRRNVAVLVAAWLMVISTGLHAGAKKGDDKKKKPAGPIYNKSAVLKIDDPKDTKPGLTDRPRQVFPFKLTGGIVYQIDLKSKDFDAYLRLLDDKDQEVAFNDDADPTNTQDARIVYKPGKTGDFKIVVTAFNKAAGNFTLTVAEVDAKTALTTNSIYVGKTIDLKVTDGKASYTGELNEKDGSVHKRYYKVFTMTLEKGQTYRFDLRNAGDDKKFDPNLVLEDADGLRIADDDDGGDGVNSRIVYIANKTGAYRLVATTLPQMQVGRFTLEVGPNVETKKEKKGGK